MAYPQSYDNLKTDIKDTDKLNEVPHNEQHNKANEAINNIEQVIWLEWDYNFADKNHTHTKSDITDFEHTHSSDDIEWLDDAISNNDDVRANTDARHTHSNKDVLDNITDEWDWTKFLSDDWTYKEVEWWNVEASDLNTRKYLWLTTWNNNWPRIINNNVDISNKADKVENATEWDFAWLDSEWNLVDSWYNADSFASKSHTHTKSDITDFNESDYVHISWDETISDNKSFEKTIEIKEGNWWIYMYDGNWNKYKLYVNDDWELQLDKI